MQLVVADVTASARWYCEVLGLEQCVAGEIPCGGANAGSRHPTASFVIGLEDGEVKEQVAMIDHVSFSVGSIADLEKWCIGRLGRRSPVTDLIEEEASFNARVMDPDGPSVELTAPKPN